MPLLVSVLALALAASATTSQLPATVPGLSHDEGVFLVTDADNGGQAAFFVANDERHAIQDADLQSERRLNPLWPVREVVRDEVLGYPEGAPVGKARVGLVTEPTASDEPSATEPTLETQEAADPTTYTVKPGDSAIGIARASGVELDDLLAANGIADSNRIYVGQVLTIPAPTS